MCQRPASLPSPPPSILQGKNTVLIDIFAFYFIFDEALTMYTYVLLLTNVSFIIKDCVGLNLFQLFQVRNICLICENFLLTSSVIQNKLNLYVKVLLYEFVYCYIYIYISIIHKMKV